MTQGPQKIGLEAVFRDAGFQAGIAAYDKAVLAATKHTEEAAAAIAAAGQKMGVPTDQLGKAAARAAAEAEKAAQAQVKSAEKAATAQAKAAEKAAQAQQREAAKAAAAQAKEADKAAAAQAKAAERAASAQKREAEKAAAAQKKAAADAAAAWNKAALDLGKAAGVMGAGIVALLTKMTLTAARTQELGVVVQNAGKNVGYSAQQINAYDQAIQKMGITTQSSRQAMLQMIQANMDLAGATDLARLAQDAAVIAQLDSSEAFERLISVIQRGEVEMARTLGLSVNFQQAYDKMAASLGKTAKELTEAERTQARTNEVMRAGANIAGTYEAAMGTASKQMRSMARHVEELSNAMGSVLLPLLSDGVAAGTDFLKWMESLPAPVLETATQIMALSGGLGSVVGVVSVVGPKVKDLAGALATFSKGLGLSTAGLLGPAGIVAGLAALALYLKNAEDARREEATSIAAAADSYGDYISQLEAAGLGNYALSDSLYETVNAYAAAMDAAERYALMAGVLANVEKFEKALAIYEKLPGGIEMWISTVEKGAGALSESTLLLYSDAEAMAELAMQAGFSAEEAQRLAAALDAIAEAEMKARTEAELYNQYEHDRQQIYKQLMTFSGQTIDLLDEEKRMMMETRRAEAAATEEARQALVNFAHSVGLSADQVRGMMAKGMDENEIRAFADNLHLSAYEMENLATETGFTYEQIARLNAMGSGASQIQAMAAALATARGQMTGFLGAIATGINDLNGIDQSLADLEKSNRDAMAGIASDTAAALGEVKKKFDESLPDPTSVAERAKMVADAWDEFALRMGSVKEIGAASEWFQPMVDALAGTEFAFDASKESAADWAARVQEAFYAGDMKGMINEDAQAWKDHAAKVGEAQTEEVAAIQAGAAEKRAAQAAAYAEEKAELERQLQEKKMMIALSALESSNQLQQWAQAAFGPDLAGAFDTAGEVFAGLQAGIIPVDQALGDMIAGVLGGLDSVRTKTAEVAQANKDAMSDLTGEEWVTAAEKKVASLEGTLKTLQDNLAAAFDEGIDVEAVQDDFNAIQEAIDDVMKPPEEGGEATPVQPLIDAVDGFVTLMGEGPMSTAMSGETDLVLADIGEIVAALAGIPPTKETSIDTPGLQEAIDTVNDYLTALGKIPPSVSTTINVTQTGNNALAEPQSPELGLQHAIEALPPYTLVTIDTVVQGASEFGDVLSTLTVLMDLLHALRRYAGGDLDLGPLEQDLRELTRMLLNLRAGLFVQSTSDIADVFSSIQSVLDVMGTLAEYQAVDASRFGALQADVVTVVEVLRNIVATIMDRGVPLGEGLILVMERLGAISSALSQVLDTLSQMVEYTDVPTENLEMVRADIVELVGILDELAGTIDGNVLDDAVEIAVGLGIVGKELGNIAEGLVKVKDYVPGSLKGKIEPLVQDIVRMEELLGEAAANLEQEGLKAATDFAKAAGSMAGGLSDAVDGLSGIFGYRGIAPGSLERLMSDVDQMVGEVNLMAAQFTAKDLEKLTAMGEMLSSATGGITSAFDALVGIASYRGGVARGVEPFMADVEMLFGMYERFQDIGNQEHAEAVSDYLQTIAAGTNAALDALIGIASYRGGIDTGLNRFTDDVLRLAAAFEDLGEAIPWFFIPGSPTAFETGLRGINREMTTLAARTAPTMVDQSRHLSMPIGPVSIGGEMDMRQFEARVTKIIKQELR